MADAPERAVDPIRNRFLEIVLAWEGQPYCWPTEENNWSGKGWKGAKYQGCHDCSGTVTDGLYQATDGALDWRMTTNAQRLFNLTEKTEDPIPGDLAFYGPGRNMVSHVMVVVGERDGHLAVFGACGGDHTTTSPERARAKGARLRHRRSHLYRPDFLGFTRLPTRPPYPKEKKK